MALIPKAQFPNVPNLPGVPQVVRSPLHPPSAPPVIGTAIALGRLWQALFVKPLWAIYRHPEAEEQESADGIESVTVTAEREPVLVPDSFLTFSHRREANVATYPIQNGGYVNYDKVLNPAETFIRVSKGGSAQDRRDFLETLDSIIENIGLYDILTPEKTYLNVDIMRYDLVREGAKGAYFFAEVDIYFQEIRQVQAQYSNTDVSNPSLITQARQAEDDIAKNIGTVQAQQAATLTPESLGIMPPELEFE